FLSETDLHHSHPIIQIDNSRSCWALDRNLRYGDILSLETTSVLVQKEIIRVEGVRIFPLFVSFYCPNKPQGNVFLESSFSLLIRIRDSSFMLGGIDIPLVELFRHNFRRSKHRGRAGRALCLC